MINERELWTLARVLTEAERVLFPMSDVWTPEFTARVKTQMDAGHELLNRRRWSNELKRWVPTK